MMQLQNIPEIFTRFLALILALTIHEGAHAMVAHLQGDLTPKLSGRATLNPFVHMDPIGTVVFPLMSLFSGSPIFFGWAKPVPIDPSQLKYRRFGEVLVAAAGPVANLLFAFVAVFLFEAYQVYFTTVIPSGSFFYPLIGLCSALVWVNAFLAFFNLIPIPPLDGASVLALFFPQDLIKSYEQNIAPYGFIIILVLSFTGMLNWLIPVVSLYVSLAMQLAQLIL